MEGGDRSDIEPNGSFNLNLQIKRHEVNPFKPTPSQNMKVAQPRQRLAKLSTNQDETPNPAQESSQTSHGGRQARIVKVLALLATSHLFLNNFGQVQAKGMSSPEVDRFVVVSGCRNFDSDSFRRFNESIMNFKLDSFPLMQRESKDYTDSHHSLVTTYLRGLASFRNDRNVLIMLLDADISVVNAYPSEIISTFMNKFPPQTRILFATEDQNDQTIPNSDAMIGFASDLWDLLSKGQKGNDIQRIALEALSESKQETHYLEDFEAVKLDKTSQIFQTLVASPEDTSYCPGVDIEPTDGIDNWSGARLKNLRHQTSPLVAVASSRPGQPGKSIWHNQLTLNAYANYLGGRGALANNHSDLDVDNWIEIGNKSSSQSVLIALFIDNPTPFIDELFLSIIDLEYPRDKLHLFLFNSVAYHDNHVAEFKLQIEREANGGQPLFASLHVEAAQREYPNSIDGWKARELALKHCVAINCANFLSLDSTARLDAPEVLKILIGLNRQLVAPLISRPGKLWSNFWGSLGSDGLYHRSKDYLELVNRNRRGIWNVPHAVNSAYMVRGDLVTRLAETAEDTCMNIGSRSSKFEGHLLDGSLDKQPDGLEELTCANSSMNTTCMNSFDPALLVKSELEFSSRLRTMGVFQWLVNIAEFGHLVDPTTFDLTKKHPDLYQLKDNPLDWEQRYLHENYSKIFDDEQQDDDDQQEKDIASKLKPERSDEDHWTGGNDSPFIEQPCQDVYWFPLVSKIFARHLIDTMETHGGWSSGKHEDERIEGGYESVPTRDIHARQIGFHQLWLDFLRDYVMPVQLKQFIGYEHDPPNAELAFVVRYHPTEQAFLKPHHDSSTYTLNIALNQPGIDYEGGGCRFVRYNCSVTESRLGWALIHPGRLTHYHEGLPVTNGTRYIFVTFIDP